MARATTETLLPLATWAKIMQLNPWEFEQIGTGFPRENYAQCDHVFFQYSWQQDFLSREEIAQTIQLAEDMLAAQLHYYPAPKYFIDEAHQFPKLNSALGWGNGLNASGRLKAVELNWHKVLGGGVRARTLIRADAAVVLSDENGDGIDDLFTITVPTSVTEPGEIAAYFAAGDRQGEDVSESWRIRPVKVTISGGNAVITGHPSLLVDPALTTVTDPGVLNVTNAATYVTTVDVYRVYRNDDTDTGLQGNAVWENGDCNDPPCTAAYSPLCIGARDPDLGFVSVNYQLDGTACPTWEPDQVVINYLAGEALVNGEMSPQMADVVAHLATALLPMDKCGCERADKIIAYWREVPPAGGEGLRSDLVGDFTVNPLGPQRGAVYAWNRVLRLRQL
jgi:hypothetical protein